MRNAVIAGYVPLALPFRGQGRLRQGQARRSPGPGDPGPAGEDGVPGADIEDLMVGCAMPEGEQGLNIARLAGLLAGLPQSVAGDHGQPLLRLLHAGDPHGGGRHRGSAAGEVFVCAGVESHDPGADGRASIRCPIRGSAEDCRAYISMGETAENLARKYQITRDRAGEARRRQPCPGRRGRRRRASSPTRSCRSPPAMSGSNRTAASAPDTTQKVWPG